MLNQDCRECLSHAKIVQGRKVGSLYIDYEHKSKYVTRYGVYIQGDGTLQGDTVCLGIFWDKKLAQSCMQNILLKTDYGKKCIRKASKYMNIFGCNRICEFCETEHKIKKYKREKK